MKKLFIYSAALLICACQQPYAEVTTNDEKSETIKTLFEKVGEENIDYLKEIFSDSMEFSTAEINPDLFNLFPAGSTNSMLSEKISLR